LPARSPQPKLTPRLGLTGWDRTVTGVGMNAVTGHGAFAEGIEAGAARGA